MTPILPQSAASHARDLSSVSRPRRFAAWQRQHLQWLAAALILPLGMTLTAYGVVEFGPQTQANVSVVSETLATPVLSTQAETISPRSHLEVIRSGDTIGRVLARMGVVDSQLQQFIKSDETARKLFELSPGRILHASSNAVGDVSQLSYVTNNGEEVQIVREGNYLSASSGPVSTQTQTVMKSGRINSSFFAATDAADIPDAITQQLIDLFASRVDFHHTLQKGDQFSVIYETEVHQGSMIKPGRIIAAQFINKGNVHEAMWFADGKGGGDYYALDGSSLKQGFISTPVKFSRISSGFAMRFHPVLFTWKQHRGVDYAAPTGTEVQATADGVITRLATDAGYGNFIEIKHDGKYSTLYAHLSAFAKGLKEGQTVSQGQVIGAVGQTGRVTGPHLHYEFKINGEQVDPLTVALPQGKKLSVPELQAFAPLARSMKRQLSLAGQVELAQLE
ncbi:peptidoglycan DD-metalloendopeptidase family protein [Chitinibacter sp. FCG-7]|uniref:Peptidoglycan DD-metalloendopeptidase family protein n=1 Tax=Chitinibacter mangrovi TaxID=3153927 RepID=A0AAU7F9F7_9NEIS